MILWEIFDFFTALYTHAILIIGIIGCIVGFFIKFFPTIVPYGLLIRVFSVIILMFGIYLEGGLANERNWKEKVAVAEERMRYAEKRAEEATTKVEVVYVDRVKTIKDVQTIIQEKIVEVAPKLDAQCTVAPEAISILNQAATGKK